MPEKLYVIDGMAYAFRSYFAIRNLRDSKGRPTNAVFGFARMLLKILREHEPSHIVMVFDAPGKTFRDDMYPDYKAHRDETPADLISQFPRIDELVEAFDIPILRIPGVEADDVLATLSRKAEAEGMEAVLVSGDKDILQSVSEHTKVFDPNRGDNGKWYGPDDVLERYGVPPENVIDMLGLMGDSADNVPGVRGIGEKTARKLLEQYKTIEGIYEHIDELKGKQKEKLIEDREMAMLSRELVTLDENVTLQDKIESYRRKDFDNPKLAELFADLEFRTLFEEFAPDVEEVEATDYETVQTMSQLKSLVKEAKAAGSFAVDTETTSVQPVEAALVGISISFQDNTGYYIPLAYEPDLETSAEAIDIIPPEQTISTLKPLLEDEEVEKVGHNIKYDYIVLKRHGIDLAGIGMDTMIASYLTNPSRFRHNLSEVSLQYLRRKMIPISDLIGKGSKAITFEKVPIDKASHYACEDADVTWQLAGVFCSMLSEQKLEDLFQKVELPLIRVLAKMEMVGVAIDTDLFDSLRREIGDRLKALEADIFELAGGPFQINSPKQLQTVLFEDLGLPPKKKTKTGYSTDVEVLEELAQEHPLPERVLEYRSLEKLRGTYVDALPKLVNSETGRIHTSFNQAVAATGRLSSSDPNLQNIPVRTDLGRRIRECFVPGRPGAQLISADYSQIELRILAHLSGDERLIEAFKKNLDIHRDTASRVFGVPPDSVTADMRRQAKAVNFGVVYGISAFGLAKNIRVSRAEAAKFIDNYFAQYPKIREWTEQTKNDAKRLGYVKTLLDRRRYIPELEGSDAASRRAAERVAVNTPVQGSAADIIKIAMIRLDEALSDTESKLILQVHDELVVESPEEESLEIAGIMTEIMEGAFDLDVPLVVDIGIGNNWAEVH